jgi:single-stranded DNA-specific DHH superfamily exonuclease
MKNLRIFNVKNNDVYKILKEHEPLKIAYHHDADGVASAALLATVFDIVQDKVYPCVPSHFGMYHDGDVAVDLGSPKIEEYKGVMAIDHHEHPDDPKYPLVLGNVPTGVTIFELLKEHIPKEKYWLCALSAVGDGQPEVIPDEVWEQHPELWSESGNIYRDAKYKVKGYPYPLFAKLSSPVNALCRIGATNKALELVMRSDNMREVIENKLAQTAQKEISSEENKMFMDKSNPLTIEKIGHYGIVAYHSKFNLAGRLGANMTGTDKNTTYVIVNADTGEASIRGVMAKYLANKLTANGIQAGGHAGFAGISLTDEQTAEDLIHTLRKILIK